MTMTTPNAGLEGLLPCPFCGGPASIDWGKTGRYVGVECDNCGAYGGEQKGISHDADRSAMEFLAITAWNTRPQPGAEGESGFVAIGWIRPGQDFTEASPHDDVSMMMDRGWQPVALIPPCAAFSLPSAIDTALASRRELGGVSGDGK
jgi:hypothetical protein